MTIGQRLAALERAHPIIAPHRHRIVRVITLAAPAPDDAALRRWEREQSECRCADADHGVLVIGRGGAVHSLQESLL